VASGVRRFRTEKDGRRRIDLIRKIGPINDPRVTVALMEEIVLDEDAPESLLMLASYDVVNYHVPEGEGTAGWTKSCPPARIWWEGRGDEVRRRAAALPR